MLARFVSPDDERHWIGVAAGASVRRLERELRAVDRGALDTAGLEREADASNLTTLCAFHHQRGVHDGKVTVRGRAPDALRFELGLRPDRVPLAAFLSGDRVA